MPIREELIKDGIRTTFLGIVANFLLAIIKGIAGVFGHSFALVADSMESSGDILTSLFVLIGLKTASRPPDENHPYGHGRAEPLAAMAVSAILLGASVVIAVQSLHYILTPHEGPKAFTLWILGGVVIIKEILFRYSIRKGKEIGSVAVRADAFHHRSDAVTSLAAFVGISVALIGGEGYESADDWAALIASGFIALNAYAIIRPALSEVMEEAQPPELIEAIKKEALTVEGVFAIDKCYVRKMGFVYYVDIHLVVDRNLTVKRGHDIAHNVKDALRASSLSIADVLTHVEPDGEIPD